MNTRRFFLLLIGNVWLLYGCFSGLYCPDAKTDLVKLSADTRQWFTYSPGQLLVFRDAQGNQDTLNVIQFSDATENYWQGDECPDRPQESIKVKLVSRASADTIAISGEFGNQLRIVKESILLTYFTDNNRVFPDNQPSNYKYSERLMIGNESYSNVLMAKCLQCRPNKINELYIAKATGLIAYVKDDNLWILKQ